MSPKQTDRPKTGARRELQKERFGAYFPRVFAYALCTSGDEDAARDITIVTFSDVFAMPDMREEEFEFVLFRTARQVVSSHAPRVRRRGDGLSAREREVISFIFDAQLDRAQVARVLGIRDETVVATLLRGLRKLKIDAGASGAGAPVPSFS